MQCRLKKSESHSKITANRRHIKAAAPFFLRQPSVARCPSAVRPHAVRSPPFVCRPGPRPLPPTAHTTKKEPRRRLPGVQFGDRLSNFYWGFSALGSICRLSECFEVVIATFAMKIREWIVFWLVPFFVLYIKTFLHKHPLSIWWLR